MSRQLSINGVEMTIDSWSNDLTTANNEEFQKHESAMSFNAALAFNVSTPQFEMLRISNGTILYNFSLLAQTKDRLLLTSMGSFDSADGEYLPSWRQLSLSDLNWDLYLPLLRNLIHENNLTIDGFSYPQDRPFECDIPNYREMALLTVCNYYFSLRMWLGERITMIRSESSILDCFAPLIASLSYVGPHSHLSAYLVRIYNHEKQSGEGSLRVGSKLYPLRNIHDQTTLPLITPWNELYCLQLTNQLRRRMICPFYPQYFGNSRLPNTNIHLFQNQALLERFAANKKAVDDMDKIRQRLELEQDTIVLEALETAQRHMLSNAVLSGQTLVVYLEHVPGWSVWARRFNLVERYSPFEHQLMVFPIMYGLYNLALNRILHTDLHLGNVLMESIPLYQQHIAFDHYTLPMPDPSLVKLVHAARTTHGGSSDVDRPYVPPVYDADLNIAADTLIGEPKLDPALATPLYGTFDIAYPLMSSSSRIIDFSRAVILNPVAYEGFQPYRADMLEQRNKQLWALYVTTCNSLDELAGASGNVDRLDQLEFAAVAENHLDALFRALEGCDFWHYCSHAIAALESTRPVYEPRAATGEKLAQHALKQGANFADLFRRIERDLHAIVAHKIRLLSDSRYAVLESFDSPYPVLIREHMTFMVDGPPREFHSENYGRISKFTDEFYVDRERAFWGRAWSCVRQADGDAAKK